MNNSKRIIPIVIAIAIIVTVILFIFKLITGAISLINMSFNAIIAIFVIIALIVIVTWMLIYAKKNRK